jgi:histidyl-tRNA synthetase
MDRLPGFRDFYPEPVPVQDVWSADVRRHLFDTWRKAASRYGFQEYDGPPLEPLELFTTKSGEEIVGQLYNFTDKGGREIALRPEMTPTLARMAAAYERQYKKPIKWYSIPQLFRYERQQKGRLREHFQLNADILGEPSVAADAELIALLIDSLRLLGLTTEDFVVRLSSRTAWQEFFQARCSEASKAYEFYQAVDKMERESEEVTEAKMAAVGIRLEEVRAFIQAGEPTVELAAVLGDLRSRGLERFVRVDYNVIRGLAYYTGPVFEAFDQKGQFRAIAGGGRYDNLVKLISGGKVSMPALGFGMGDVVLTELLKERGLLPKMLARIQVYCLVEDETLRPATLGLVQALREAGVAADYSLVPAKPDKQFKRALELNGVFSAKMERTTAGDLQARVKRLATREEKLCSVAEAVDFVGGLA